MATVHSDIFWCLKMPKCLNCTMMMGYDLSCRILISKMPYFYIALMVPGFCSSSIYSLWIFLSQFHTIPENLTIPYPILQAEKKVKVSNAWDAQSAWPWVLYQLGNWFDHLVNKNLLPGPPTCQQTWIITTLPLPPCKMSEDLFVFSPS